MTAITHWLHKLSNARDTKVVKLILIDAINELAGSTVSKVYLFEENAKERFSDLHKVSDSFISLCHEKKSIFYLSANDKEYIHDLGFTTVNKSEEFFVIPINLENPIGAIIGLLAHPSTTRPPAIEKDKCIIVAEAGAIAFMNVLIHIELSNQIAEKSAELMEVTQDAENANRVKSRYLSAASHDLRQPLQQLTSLLNVMVRRSKEPESLSELKKMQRITSGMDRLLSRLLHLEQLEQGVIVPEIAPIALDEILVSIEEDFHQKADDKGIVLTVNKSGLYVVSDVDLLLQIIRNLTGNAVKYTAKGTIKLYTESNGDFVTLVISDTGPGIALDQQQLVFDPFYQIPDSRKQDSSYGLGLSLVKALAEALAVPIVLDSEPENGTQFSLTLPISKLQVQELASSQGELIQANTVERANILYLEDDEILIDSFTMLLEMVGFGVKVAKHSGEFEDLISKEPNYIPDVIVTDKNLERGENGLVLVEHIRDELNKSEIPAILLTGYTEVKVIEEALETVQSVLSKPIDIDILVIEIENLINE